MSPIIYQSEMDDFQVPLSREERYCEGYWNPTPKQEGNYLVSFVLGTGVASLQRGKVNDLHNLEAIDAFDRAEVAEAYIGQINMVTVSSFCGPYGRIWGYDLAAQADLRKPLDLSCSIPTYSLEPLLIASKTLFGTVDEQRFPLLPGSHVPCANKSITRVGPGYVYCGLAVGIPKDRKKAACLIMEDVGWVDRIDDQTKKVVMERMAESVIRIGINQRVEYLEIFCGTRYSGMSDNEIGCALAAAPYFTLARQAAAEFLST